MLYPAFARAEAEQTQQGEKSTGCSGAVHRAGIWNPIPCITVRNTVRQMSAITVRVARDLLEKYVAELEMKNLTQELERLREGMSSKIDPQMAA